MAGQAAGPARNGRARHRLRRHRVHPARRRYQEPADTPGVVRRCCPGRDGFPGAAGEVRAAAYQALAGTLGEHARRVHQIAAGNVRRVGDVDKSRPGLFLFNHFAGDDPGLAVELWDYLAGWYEAETGLDNSTLLGPLEGEESDYLMINHARWDHSLPLFMARQLPKRTLPQLHAGQPESPPPQRHARPVPSGLTRSPERW